MLKVKYPECPNCTINNNVSLKYSQVNGFDIYICINCKNGFTYPIPKNLSKYYHSNYWLTPGLLGNAKGYIFDLFQNRRKIWLLHYLKKGRILEVGCGEGNFEKKVGKGFAYTGIEFPKAKITNAEVLKVDYLNWKTKQKFNAIIFWESLEHILSPQKYLQKSFELLEKDGLVLIELPKFNCLESKIFNKHWFHLDPPRHLNHITNEGIIVLAKNGGFKIIKAKSVLAPEYTIWGLLESILILLNLKSTDIFKKGKQPVFSILLLPLIPLALLAEMLFFAFKQSPISFIALKKHG